MLRVAQIVRGYVVAAGTEFLEEFSEHNVNIKERFMSKLGLNLLILCGIKSA